MNKQIKKKRLKNLKPSKQLLKALKEAEDIASGKIKVPSYTNIEEFKKSIIRRLKSWYFDAMAFLYIIINLLL